MKFEYGPAEPCSLELRIVWLLCAALQVDCEEYDEQYRRAAQDRSSLKRASIKNEEERHIVTIINILIDGDPIIKTLLGKDKNQGIFDFFLNDNGNSDKITMHIEKMNYEEFSESLNYLMNIGLLSKRDKRLFVNDDFKQWFIDIYGGIGTLINGNTKRLKQVFYGVQAYIYDIEQKKYGSRTEPSTSVKKTSNNNDYITKLEYEIALEDVIQNNFYQ
jgi:hypothetical protein